MMRAAAADPAYQAGILRMTAADGGRSLPVAVWYPTKAASKPWQVGPFTIEATLDAPIAGDGPFPVLLLSHGRRSAPLSHRELAASLARAGFIVVAPTHVGDAAGQPPASTQGRILMDRPRQALAALDAVLSDARFTASADAKRLGGLGFSAGGYTALIAAGARPNFTAALDYCRGEGRDDIGSCGPVKDDLARVAQEMKDWQPPAGPSLRALVLMDPLAVMFDAPGLGNVTAPALLLRPQDDAYMSAGPNAEAVKAGLKTAPEEIIVPGRHFVFIDPCPPALAAEAEIICKDGPDVDRAAIHRKFEQDIAAFLRRHL